MPTADHDALDRVGVQASRNFDDAPALMHETSQHCAGECRRVKSRVIPMHVNRNVLGTQPWRLAGMQTPVDRDALPPTVGETASNA